MKKAIQQYGALLLVLILVSGVCLLFSLRKSGMFIDEIYTYGLSNSHFAPYVNNIHGGDSFVDDTLTRGELLSYLVVDPGEDFDFASVVYNQAADVHPPLYYWLFNAVSSLTPNTLSKWTGLALDYVIYMVCLLLLFALARALGLSPTPAAAVTALYGLSVTGLSTMLMIRMYVLMTALTVALALLVVRLMRGGRRADYVSVGLVIFLGLMTQYYFVFYAFFLCAAYVFYCLGTRRWKSMAAFAVCAFLGVGGLLLAFPQCLQQLTADKLVSGGSAMENLLDLSQYPRRLISYFGDLRHGLKAAATAGIALLLPLLFAGKRLRRLRQDGRLELGPWLVVLLPLLPTFLLVAILSPVLDQRYMYNLGPILCLAAGLPLLLLERCFADLPRLPWLRALLCAGLVAWALHLAHYNPPLYLYPEYRDYDALVESCADDPCVYMTANYFAPVTQDLLQLLAFDEVFFTGDPASPALARYLAARGGEECVVYIDVSKYWSSGFDPEEMLPALLENTPYTSSSLLYANGLSRTYVLR